jgi:hypothetical protein
MTGCPQSWQIPSNITNDLRRIFSAVIVSTVRMAGTYVPRSRIDASGDVDPEQLYDESVQFLL